jgi:hypothetical protein
VSWDARPQRLRLLLLLQQGIFDLQQPAMPHAVSSTSSVEPPKLFESPPWSATNDRGYSIPEVDYGTPRPIKVIAVGAGISGIALAHAVATSGPGIELQAYDIASDYSGTWHWNTYDGVRCGELPAFWSFSVA